MKIKTINFLRENQILRNIGKECGVFIRFSHVIKFTYFTEFYKFIYPTKHNNINLSI